jgi:hypothetical protein
MLICQLLSRNLQHYSLVIILYYNSIRTIHVLRSIVMVMYNIFNTIVIPLCSLILPLLFYIVSKS